jgi:hypothetical protein
MDKPYHLSHPSPAVKDASQEEDGKSRSDGGLTAGKLAASPPNLFKVNIAVRLLLDNHT